MKNQNRISQLTLELYYRGLATNKERKQVENALAADREVRDRYEALKESDRQMRLLVSQELKRMNAAQTLPSPPPQKRKVAAFFILAAAVLLCALIPVILYLKNSGSNKNNVLAEETTHEIKMEENTDLTDDIPNMEIASPFEPPLIKTEDSGGRTEIAENPRVELRTEPVTAAEPETRLDPASGISVATAPAEETGVRMRGSTNAEDQAVTTLPQEPSNLNIPPGFTFIFDSMFADRELTFIIIPSRIRSIGKNAFSGNPLLSVSIGADVSVADNSIPGNFAEAYNAGGKTAGIYTRSGVDSEDWGLGTGD